MPGQKLTNRPSGEHLILGTGSAETHAHDPLMIDARLIEPVLFIRWRERCDAADVVLIKRHTEQASHKVDGKLVYVSLIPVGVPPPDAAARAALRDGTAHAREHCASVHVVIEGEGLRRALIRSVSAGLLLTTRGSFHIHSNLRAALDSANMTVPMDVEAIVAQATEQGMMGEA